MKLRSLWKRGLAAFVSMVVLAPSMLTPLGGVAAAEEYDTTPVVAHFSAAEKTFYSKTDPEKILRSDWQYADDADAEQGIDVSGHDLSKLALRMTITLALDDGAVLPDGTDKNKLFSGGWVKLRSVDRTNVEGDPEAEKGNKEHNIGFSLAPLRLGMGTRDIEINLAEWVANNQFNHKGVFDVTALNRFNLYIDSIPKDIRDIPFTMTLSNVFLVDTTREDQAQVKPRVATSSEGMQSMDKIVYSVDATELGADKTGVVDSTLAIQKSINKLPNGGVVFLPAGCYKVAGTLNIPSAVTLRGEWVNPDKGGIGKGTILMAYAGKGNTDPTDHPFITMSSGACLRDISVWYPEQNAENPVPYSATILGYSHTDVINVTLYNAYYGFYNNSCSSMLIRQLYGTVLYRGIHGAYAYDIPRIENVTFDTKYWAESGFDGAPSGEALTKLNQYAENNLIAIEAAEQDWGYWYDLNINHANRAVSLTLWPDDPGEKMVPGNIAAGKVTTRNVQYGLYLQDIGYPGFQLTYSDIEASEYGMYIPPKPDYSAYEQQGIEAKEIKYYENATIAISATSFKGGKAGVWSDKSGNYGIDLNDCTFAGWSEAAIRLADGNLVCSNSTFTGDGTAVQLENAVAQAVLVGNSFGSARLNTGRVTLKRDDKSTAIPHTPDYDYTYISDVQPTDDAIFDVTDFGAVFGSTSRIPDQDSTAAIQSALDAAGAAGGGTVYIPAGVYRVDGSLTVPSGVELRGSFESAHYGNSTWRGTQLYAYGSKGNADGAPLITLEEGAGVKGFTVFYPEQGYSDQATDDDQQVYAYPPTIRANKNTWIQNMAMVACYTAIDAYTNNCDNIVITDVTGAALYATLELGHGSTGGYVQNLHFNYSGWVQQGAYANRPTGDEKDINTTNGMLTDYTTRVTKGLILGDAKNVNFFSCFNIIVAEQIVLEKDSYTGGDFEGTMWGVAFDAATNGVVGRAGSEAKLNIISSMGVFNRQNGGYFVKTDPDFKGYIGLYNEDAWDERSNIADVGGGSVDLVQFFSWCVYHGIVHEGGTLNVYGSVIVSNNGDNSGNTPDVTYEPGSFGEVIGNLDCRERLNVITQSGSYVVKKLNGTEVTQAIGNALLFSDFANRDRTADNTNGGKNIVESGWVTYDDGTANAGVDLSGVPLDSLRVQMTVTLTKEGTDDPDEELFRTGRVMLRSTDLNGKERWLYWPMEQLGLHTGENVLSLKLSDAKQGDTAGQLAIDMQSVNRLRIYIDSLNRFSGKFTMQVRNAQVVDIRSDTTGLDQQRQKLKELLDGQKTAADLSGYTAASVQDYNQRFDNARTVYNDANADSTAIVEQIVRLNAADTLLTREGENKPSVSKTKLKIAIQVAQALNTTSYTPASVKDFTDALDAAANVDADESATQTQVNNAITKLQEAQDALVKRADISALTQAVQTEDANPVDENQYTELSYKDYKEALDVARTWLADENATQADVDTARKALIDTKEALKPLQKGDVDQSGDVTIIDALMALQQAAKKVELNGRQQVAADVDGVTGVTATDALLILKYATRQIHSFS